MSIYEHFRPDEEVFVDKVLEWKRAAEYHQVKLTDFLDAEQQQIVSMVIGQGDVAVQLVVQRLMQSVKEHLFIQTI